MALITKVLAREVLDSRGNPTVEVELWAGDLNGDGLINVLDIVLVVNLIIGSN